MNATRVVVTSGGDLQPLVSSPASLAPSSPTGMSSLHQSDTVSCSSHGGESVRTTHFPALRHDSPTRSYDATSSPSPLYSPSHSPSKHHHPSHPKVLPASPLTHRSTPSRHSHSPSATPLRSGSNAPSRHSHPAAGTPSNGVALAPESNGITLTPASNDTSKIIHEKNKSVTIVLGEQQVAYSTPSRQTSVPESSDDRSSIGRASYIVRITEGTDSPKINSVTCIDTTNEVNTLKSKGSEDSDKGVSNPIIAGHTRKSSYNSTAYTTNGSSSYSSANGVMKSWQDAYAAGFHEEGSDDWRRSTSTLVPSAKLKAGDHVSWRSIASLVTGAALVLSAAAFLRLPGLLVVYGPGTFVPVVLLCLLVVAAPLALLEAGLAQFSSCSVIAVWRLLPLARGIGWSLVLLCGMWGVYTAGLAAPWLHYFLVTTAPPGAIQSVEVSNCSWAAIGDADAALHYYRHCVYGTSAEGGVGFNWPLPAGVLSLCFCAFLGAAGGASLHAVFSGIALVVALTGSVTQGCLAGWQLLAVLPQLPLTHLVAPLLTPALDILAAPQVWLAGLGQALLMLGPGTALLLNHASRFQFRFRVRRHIVVLTVLSVLVTLLVAVVTVLQMSLIRVEDLRSQQSTVYSKREAMAPSLPVDFASPTFLPSTAAADGDQMSPSPALQVLPNTLSSSGSRKDFSEQKQYFASVVDGSVSSDGAELSGKKKRSLPMDEDLNDSFTTEPSDLPKDTFTPTEMVESSSLPTVQPSLPPLEATLPVLSLMSANSQTVRPDPASNSNSGSSSDISVGSRIKVNETPSLKPQSESDDQFKFTAEPEGVTEATPPSTTCLDTSENPADTATSAPPALTAATSSQHCFLQSIKHGTFVHGPCAHQEVSTGGVFLLISHSLLYHHVPMEWLRPIFAAVILCGVLCSGLATVCGCLCVASVAGRESSHVAAVVGAGVGLLFTLLGAAPFVAESGLQLLSLLDVGVITPAIVWPATLMTVAIAAAHGMGKIRKDFIFIIEKDISIMWVVWWAFVIPVTLVGVFVWQCVDWWRYGYSYRVFNTTTALPFDTETETVYILWWQMAVVWALRVLLVLPIPIVAIKVINSQLAYGIKDKLVSALQSSREWGEWGPQDPIEHHNWRRWREDETRPFASLERRLANRPLTYTHSTLSRNSSGGSSLSKLRSKYQRKELPVHATATAL